MWMIVFFLCWVVRIEAGCNLQDETRMEVTKYSGESVLLPCSCTDLQAQGTRWFKDGLQIGPTKPEDMIQMTNQDSPGNLSLLISDLTKKDWGWYRCEGHHNSYRDFILTVTGAVSPANTLTTKSSPGKQTPATKEKDTRSNGETKPPFYIFIIAAMLLLLLLLGGALFLYMRRKGQRERQMGNDNRQRRGTDQERDMSATSTYEVLQHRYNAEQMYSTVGQNAGV